MTEKIKTFVQTIKKHTFYTVTDNLDKINQLTEDDNDFLKDLIQEDFEEKYQIPIKRDQLKLNVVSGLELNWETTIENIYIYGGMEIRGLIDALIMPPDSIFEDNSCEHDFLTEEKEHFLKEETNWFCKSAHGSGNGTYAIFHREKEKYPFDILFLDQGLLFKTNFTHDNYYQHMIDSMAICGWQYFYLDFDEIKTTCANFKISTHGWLSLYPYGDNMSDSPLGRNITEDTLRIDTVLHHMKKCAYLLPKLFPNKDFSYHKKRYQEFENYLNT